MLLLFRYFHTASQRNEPSTIPFFQHHNLFDRTFSHYCFVLYIYPLRETPIEYLSASLNVTARIKLHDLSISTLPAAQRRIRTAYFTKMALKGTRHRVHKRNGNSRTQEQMRSGGPVPTADQEPPTARVEDELDEEQQMIAMVRQLRQSPVDLIHLHASPSFRQWGLNHYNHYQVESTLSDEKMIWYAKIQGYQNFIMTPESSNILAIIPRRARPETVSPLFEALAELLVTQWCFLSRSCLMDVLNGLATNGTEDESNNFWGLTRIDYSPAIFTNCCITEDGHSLLGLHSLNSFFIARFIDRVAEPASLQHSTNSKTFKPIESALRNISKGKEVITRTFRPKESAFDASCKVAQDWIDKLQENNCNIIWLGQNFVFHPLEEKTSEDSVEENTTQEEPSLLSPSTSREITLHARTIELTQIIGPTFDSNKKNESVISTHTLNRLNSVPISKPSIPTYMPNLLLDASYRCSFLKLPRPARESRQS